MGLDMYLCKMPRNDKATANDVVAIETYLGWKENPDSTGYTLEKWCGISEESIKKELVDFYEPYYTEKYSIFDTEKTRPIKMIIQVIGYWRKVNAVHNWFVQNVQFGVDDCKHYDVSKEDLQRLLEICKSVMKYRELNSSAGEALLPTISGFCFGDTEYDEYYYSEIEDTIATIEKVLNETDFEKEMLSYSSSW